MRVRLGELPPPILRAAYLAVDGGGDARRAGRVRRLDLVDAETVEEGVGDARRIVGGRQPERARGVDRQLDELVGEARRGLDPEQPVGRAQGAAPARRAALVQ